MDETWEYYPKLCDVIEMLPNAVVVIRMLYIIASNQHVMWQVYTILYAYYISLLKGEEKTKAAEHPKHVGDSH